MIEVKLVFKTPDEAIVALAKMAGSAGSGAKQAPVAAVTAGSAQAAPATSAAPQTSATKSERKPRADAGKPRGPHARSQSVAVAGETPASNPAAGGEGGGEASAEKPAVTSENTVVTGAYANAPESVGAGTVAPTPTDGQAPVPANQQTPISPASAAPATMEQAEAALTKLFESPAPNGGLVAAQGVLARFGVKRLKEMLPEHRNEFIAKCERVMNGEAV